MRLDDNIRFVHGIGPAKATRLAHMGIETLRDALWQYPREYEDRTQIVPISALQVGEKASICAVVGTQPSVKHIRRGMDVTKCTVFDDSGTIALTFFNNRYAAASLQQGKCYLFYGMVQAMGRQQQMVSPVFEPVRKESEPEGRIVPVYPLTAGIGQGDIYRVTQAALEAMQGEEIEECLPDFLREKYALECMETCLQKIHRPQTLAQAHAAHRRLIFEELLLLCCGLARLRERRRGEKGIALQNTDLSAFYGALPFPLTGAQERAIAHMVQDIALQIPMNRLVQGDVGSGKTAVAAALCVLAAQNGYQAALMAPTEILATQHYATLQPWMERCGIQCVLLTGSMGAKARRQAQHEIATGQASVVIGTHALIQREIVFAKLGAVIADEQHRFGVLQRATLSAKGETPHVLVMSATPIPRTLALLLYGDLDVSVLDELPPGRQPIETYAVGEEMRVRIYRFIEKQCALGGQAYVVCPLVEEGESALKSAQQHEQTLRKALPNRTIGVLHGRMKAAEKDAVMQAFAQGALEILVATTVIEVGVNVPNATLMVVEDADRFGLSQLHQLRGRVGRGNRQSYCIFFGADKGSKVKERLDVLTKTNDGFAIAKADLSMRGPGDFFGARQHGLPPLHVANLASDLQLMQSAKEEAAALLQADANLATYPILRKRVEYLWNGAGQGDIFN